MTTTEAALRDAAISAVAKIEMDREGYPLSRTQEEIYADAAEMVDAVLSLSQPSPASSTAGEARAILDRVPVSEFPGKSYDDRLANARKVYAALSPLSGEPAPFELRLCETRRVQLQPDRVYIFTVDPDCPRCVAASLGEPASVAVEADMEAAEAVARFLALTPTEGNLNGIAEYFTRHRLTLSKPTPVEAGALREKIARIIDRDAFGSMRLAPSIPRMKVALGKADAILSALSETQPPRETSTETKESGE